MFFKMYYTKIIWTKWLIYEISIKPVRYPRFIPLWSYDWSTRAYKWQSIHMGRMRFLYVELFHILFFSETGSTTDWKNHLTVAENEEFDRFYDEKMREYPELINKIQFSWFQWKNFKVMNSERTTKTNVNCN